MLVMWEQLKIEPNPIIIIQQPNDTLPDEQELEISKIKQIQHLAENNKDNDFYWNWICPECK